MPSGILKEYDNDHRFPILPGSDPLPLERDEQRVGSYGFYCDYQLVEDDVSDTVKDLIVDPGVPKKVFGKRVGWAQFLKNQYLLRKQ